MRNRSFRASVCVPRQRHPVECANATHTNNLTLLLNVAGLVAFIKQLEECNDAVEDRSRIDSVYVVEVVDIPIEEVVAKLCY